MTFYKIPGDNQLSRSYDYDVIFPTSNLMSQNQNVDLIILLTT